MSSGFVSGGTVDAPIERDEAWLVAQQEVEANFKRKAELARRNDGKSLFETLEANKAAKQDAFEEAAKLKHQFQSLNEDEVEFLDSILERTRAEEDRVKKETQEGLALFRQQQEEADKKARRRSDAAASELKPEGGEETWAAGRKRKRGKEIDGVKGIKAGKLSVPAKSSKPALVNTAVSAEPSKIGTTKPPAKETDKVPDTHLKKQLEVEKEPAKKLKGSVGLVDYGSDDDDW